MLHFSYLDHPRLKLRREFVQRLSSLDRAELLERLEVDLGDPGDGRHPRPHDVTRAVVGDLAEHLAEVLLHVEQPALVPRVDHLEDLLVAEVTEHPGLELPVLGEQLEDAVFHADAGRRLDELTVRLGIKLPAHFFR